MKRSALLAGIAAVAALALSGCTFTGVASLPLPGGIDTGSHPYKVKIQFEDVLDLVPQSQCRVNDVPVGNVTKIVLVNWRAEVTCTLRGSVSLPANAVATISQTSLLGEKFVALSSPQGQAATGTLANGAMIPLARTTPSAQVEDVLAAASMLITGGGLEQVATINHELNAALQGHEQSFRDLLGQLNTFIGGLDNQKNEIVSTIDKVDRLTATLARNQKTITDTIDSSAPAVQILQNQRADLTTLLINMGKLGNVATEVINRSKNDTVANLKSLQVILKNTNKASAVIPKVLGGFLTFPFPQTVSNALFGDYGNLWATLDLDTSDLSHNFGMSASSSKAAQKAQGSLAPPRTGIVQPPLGLLPQGTTSPGISNDSDGSVLPSLGLSGTGPDDLGAMLMGGTA
jgi:phospholipid/cholesterol/gamma-HCH transport system substrate-binding protein